MYEKRIYKKNQQNKVKSSNDNFDYSFSSKWENKNFADLLKADPSTLVIISWLDKKKICDVNQLKLRCKSTKVIKIN